MQPFDTVKAIHPAGMNAIIVYFTGDDLAAANTWCQRWTHTVRAAKPAWLSALLPSYDSLVISFKPDCIDVHGVYQFLRRCRTVKNDPSGDPQHHRLKVWYGADEANDLDEIGRHTGLSSEEIIAIHSDMTYRVYAVGFAPGFAYLGELDPRLACPRLDSPRQHVPEGAVAIADRQTAVYPSESPGGWHLLGLTRAPLFDSTSATARFAVGDTVQFVAMTEQEYRNGAQHDN